ncbi:MAG: hypothetical protein WC705_03640 [Candidatus Paceibacterota bacterium]|jgi:hypothetical protein
MKICKQNNQGQARLPTTAPARQSPDGSSRMADGRSNGGQAILMVVMILGATMLGVSTIAGYIFLQKIKTATNVIKSTEAIFAADYGVECYLYKFSKDNSYDCSALPPLSNGTTVEVSSVQTGENSELIKSIGKSGNISRAFGIFIGE